MAAQSCQRAEDVALSSTQTRFFKPVREPNTNPNSSASLGPIHPQNQTSDFEEILIKRKTSFTHPQPHQLRTAIFIPGSLCFNPAIVKTLSLIEILDFTPASDPIEARQVFRIQARARNEPDPNRPSPIDISGAARL